MPFSTRYSRLGVVAAVSAAFVTAIAVDGLSSAYAEDTGGHRGGFGSGLGAGLAVGIGLGLIQGMTAPHPASGPNPDRPAVKKMKATATPEGNGSNGRAKTAPEASEQRNNASTTGVPPRGERRYVRDEILTQFAAGTPQSSIDQISRQYDLTLVESQNFLLLGGSLYRWRLGGRRLLPDVIGAIEQERQVTAAQPNYIFTLQDEAAKTTEVSRGDPAQYALGKLRIREAQQLATGKDVLVAVIDTEIDAKHPDLSGAIVKSFDALGGDANAHKHGTGMAGAIAAHGRLLGIAPDARLLAARAFDDDDDAKAMTFSVLKALQWAADSGARIVNMSFAGPFDPAMHRMLAAAYGKDLILVASGGNAGPNSAPLFPASDPDVIAVTATDGDDHLFKMATHGDYIAVAAPGVGIIVTAPAGLYNFTTGTSVAAAEVSGIAALLLERDPSLKPKDVRDILMNTATPLGSRGQNSDYGSGLANAYQAAMSLGGKSVGNDHGAGQTQR
jgi:subtilisin family serine protease